MSSDPNKPNLSLHLPALLVLALGGWFVIRPMAGDIRLLHQRVAHHGDEAARAAAIASARAEAGLAVEEAETKAAKLALAPAFDGREAMKKLSGLCADHGMNLAAATPEPGLEKLPASFRELAARAGATGDVKVWKIELTGPYAGMTRLVGGLGKATPVVVPLSLAMRPAAAPGRPAVWTLYLWL